MSESDYHYIAYIDEAGDEREYSYVDKRGELKTMTKPGDWRAKAWIAERILAPERLGDRQATVSVQTNVYAQIGIDVQALLKQGAERAKAVVDCPASVKQIGPSKE